VVAGGRPQFIGGNPFVGKYLTFADAAIVCCSPQTSTVMEAATRAAVTTLFCATVMPVTTFLNCLRHCLGGGVGAITMRYPLDTALIWVGGISVVSMLFLNLWWLQ